MSNEQEMRDDRDFDLLRRAAGHWGHRPADEATAEPDEEMAMTLAALLDGRLSESERDSVEALFAAEPAATARFLAADAAMGAQEAAPDRLIQRATALVPGAAGAAAGGANTTAFSRWLGRTFGIVRNENWVFTGRVTLAGWALGLVLFVGISVFGFEFGRYGYAVAQEQFGAEQAIGAAAQFNDLAL